MQAVWEFADYFFPQLLHILPWFVLAIVLGIGAQKLALDVLASRVFARHGVMAIVLTTAVGAFSPFCSFTVIPLIRRFLRAGVALSAVMAFWIASPSMDPEIYVFSVTQLGVPISTARLVGALLLSLAAGFIVYAAERRGYFRNVLRDDPPAAPEPTCGGTPTPAVAGAGQGLAMAGSGGTATAVATPAAVRVSEPASCSSAPEPVSCSSAPEPASCSSVPEATSCSTAPDERDDDRPWRELAWAELRKLRPAGLARDFWDDFSGLGRWVVLAVVLETMIVLYVPQEAITSTLGNSSIFSIPLAGLISIPLYVNGVAAIPVVHGLVLQGMTSGAAVTFLLGGAVTTVPAMVAVRAVVTYRVFFVYLTIGIVGSIALGFATLAVW